jgi:P pilus assembly chaperone PapD
VAANLESNKETLYWILIDFVPHSTIQNCIGYELNNKKY